MALQNRPLRPFEKGAHLHVLDWAHETARYRLQDAGRTQVKAASKAIAKTPSPTPPALPSLAHAMTGELRKLYALGHATVRSELDHQRQQRPLAVGLSKQLAEGDQPGQDPGQTTARGRLLALAAATAIHQAIERGRLLGVTGRQLRQLGEAAGEGALRAGASSHAGGTIGAGRAAAAAMATNEIIGARYTSVLDKNTCGPCAAADDGVLRPLGDPLLAPAPNPACLGGDRCRCIWVYALSNEVRGSA